MAHREYNLELTMLSKSQFLTLFREQMPHEPTTGQELAMQQMVDFLYERDPKQLFILKGYAGTGKTTLISALVRVFGNLKKRTVLLAPTGRAAKVFASYSGAKAYTIHKLIYKISQKEGLVKVKRRMNESTNTLYIIDEASMISCESSSGELFGSRELLTDVVEFVFEGENNKLLFIGDDAQLPPVQSDESPALNLDFLTANFDVNVQTYQLTDVVRQANDSGILHNATLLRRALAKRKFQLPLFSLMPFNDIKAIGSEELEDELNRLYAHYDTEDIVMVTRSNKRAYIFNNEIRNRIFYRENKLATGDFLMAIKNNYYWIDELSEVGFIANGDMMEVMSITKTRELYGFNFMDIRARLCDYPNYPDMDFKIILESLETEGASMTNEQMRQLYHEVAKDYEDIPNKRTRFLKIKNNPFLNAVQVKYSYSLTCHKTQGGQWKVVLIDIGYFDENKMDKEFVRWLYTAVTRATERVYLVNFDGRFFEDIQ
ncbi:MAG: AAA family ATPase [Bacteroidetes bacterium]|nr:AAA family ATPase [Bacteroidota bacterium]MCL2301787.1 AAA family ATPase [Lentimicrobiaceae bacterium]